MSEFRIDREASRAIREIENQMRIEGKLDNSIAADNVGFGLVPVVLVVGGLVAWALKSVGLEGVELVMVAVPIMIGLVFLGVYLTQRE